MSASRPTSVVLSNVILAACLSYRLSQGWQLRSDVPQGLIYLQAPEGDQRRDWLPRWLTCNSPKVAVPEYALWDDP